MTPERFQRIDQLLSLALDRSAAERGQFIREVCGTDQELRIELETLLASYQETGGFSTEAPSQLAAALLREEAGGQIGKGFAANRESTLGRYRVLAELGAGGMGTVYEAYDPELNRKLAVKLVRPGSSASLASSEGRVRLMREAQAMAQLSHPNVIAVYDVGTFGDQVFIAMEYVEGSTLTRWLASQERPWREVVNVFLQTGRGLAAAHAAGILHRDFKPDNVLVGRDGRPRVFDFGLARALSGEPEKPTPDDGAAEADATSRSNFALSGRALTEPGRLMGTPAYMAPEQLMGQGVDHRTDQYSFCVALYQGLYGELPFKGHTIEALVREITQGKAREAATSRKVPARLRRAVLRGLRPEPADRYPSMDALLEELLLQASRTRRRFLAVAALAILGAVTAVGGTVWKKRTTLQPSFQSIAILPLKNLGDSSDEATVDGLTDRLTTTVAQLSTATVIGPGSAARYKASPKSLPEIGRELSVDAVVSGSAKRSGSRIHVDTRLTSTATGRQLWANTFDNENGQLPVLQADMAAGLLAAVDSRRITPAQEARLASLRSVKPDVYDSCLKGWLLERRGNAADYQKSFAYFQEAIQADPDYAPAYVGLARAYMRLIPVSPLAAARMESSRLAAEALMKALSLDPNLGEAHTELSRIKMKGDWRAAEDEAKRAIELSPNDPLAHVQYSEILLRMRRLDEALVEAKRAQRLDPLSAYAQQHIAWWFWETRQYEKSIEEWHKAIELEPNRSLLHAVLSEVYDDVGRYTEALPEAQKAYELSATLANRALIAHILVHLGRTADAETVIDELKSGSGNPHSTAMSLAKLYAVLKRKEDTLKWLAYAYDAHDDDLLLLDREVDLAWLRSDPRFQDLVQRVDLVNRVGWPQ